MDGLIGRTAQRTGEIVLGNATVNNMLKQALVHDEWRSEFAGHANDSLNSKVYTERLTLKWLASQLLPHRVFPLDYAAPKYLPGRFDAVLRRRIALRKRQQAHKLARASPKSGHDRPHHASPVLPIAIQTIACRTLREYRLFST